MDVPKIWRDPAYEPDLNIQMVDPHNLDISRGLLTGVTNCTLTDGYYSDTKISGALETIDDNYIGGSWLRIYVDDTAVATLGVQDISITQAPENALKKSYTLQSVLWMLDADIGANLYTIGQNTMASTVINAICNECGKKVTFMPGFYDSYYQTAKVFERTDSFRAILADVCSTAGDQLGVNGHGEITISPYINPSYRSIDWTLRESDSDSIIIDPGYDDKDASGDAYNRTIVVATNSSGENEQTIVASSDAGPESPVSSYYRGWTKSNVHQVSDMQPFTYDRAMQLVNQYIPDDRSRGLSRDCTCMYFPVEGGQIIEWVDMQGSKSLYLAQTVEHDLFSWTSKLTLKKLD